MSDESDESDESVQDGTPSEPTMTPLQQRQEQCGALMQELETHGYAANIGLLQAPLLMLAITDLLVDRGLATREEIDTRLWDKIHDELTRKLQAVEEDELAHPKPSPFLVRATPQDVHIIGRSRNHMH